MGSSGELLMKKTALSKPGILLISCIALLGVFGCYTNAPETARQNEPKPTVAGGDHFDGGTYCVQALPQAPSMPQAVHFSNKQNGSDGTSKDFESDLAGDKLDVTFRERRHATADDRPVTAAAVNNGPIHVPAITITVADGYTETVRTSHFERSDPHDWAMGTTLVAQAGTPWGLFIYKPDVTKVGTESISGFETTKYAVDTTHQSQLEKAAGLMGQLKDYNIVGNAWVAKQNSCVLQYQIDYEEDAKDGTVQKVHYEGGVTKP
jgi:hypothetical protein